MKGQIRVILTFFATMAFIWVRYKRSGCPPFGIIPWILDVYFITPIFKIAITITRGINPSPQFFCEFSFLFSCPFIPTITIILFLLLLLLWIHRLNNFRLLFLLLCTAKGSSCSSLFLKTTGPRLSSRVRQRRW